MKKIKIKARYLLILSLLLITGCLSATSVKGQTFSYPGELTVDALYEWKVVELVLTGSISTPYLNFGSDVLEKEDVIGVTIIQSVNNVTNGTPSELLDPANIWAEFYLNGEFETNETDEINLIDLDWLNFADVHRDYFFVEPITYTNSTGNYSNFDILHNGFPQIKEEKKEELSTHNFYKLKTATLTQTSKLTGKSWIIKFNLRNDEIKDDFTDPENWQKEITTTTEKIELRFNVDTGILSYIKYDYFEHYEIEREASFVEIDEGILLIIESLTVPIGAPFSWSFAFLSIVVVGFIIYKKKR